MSGWVTPARRRRALVAAVTNQRSKAATSTPATARRRARSRSDSSLEQGEDIRPLAANRIGLFDWVTVEPRILRQSAAGTSSEVNLFHGLHLHSPLLRDTRLGGVLHPGQVSLRQHALRDSLHVTVVAGNRLHAHIDTVSPLAGRIDGGFARYSVMRVALHNASTIAERLVCVLRGKQCRPRCELECDRFDPQEASEPVVRLSPALVAPADTTLDAAFGFR